MWSGWGIRTLSSAHCAYNPFSYQNGSIWPHDNSIIAMGFKRYGFAKEAAAVSRAICDAASYFMSDRLPELFAGLDRRATGFPLRYLGSNVPQAWACGAIFAIVRALIGYAPDGRAHRLGLDPVLSEWLPRLEVDGLRIGKHCINLRFWRDGEATCFEAQGDTVGLVIERTTLPTSKICFLRLSSWLPSARGKRAQPQACVCRSDRQRYAVALRRPCARPA
jgi:hypothetical protein